MSTRLPRNFALSLALSPSGTTCRPVRSCSRYLVATEELSAHGGVLDLRRAIETLEASIPRLAQ
jgi:hypothetical protein